MLFAGTDSVACVNFKLEPYCIAVTWFVQHHHHHCRRDVCVFRFATCCQVRWGFPVHRLDPDVAWSSSRMCCDAGFRLRLRLLVRCVVSAFRLSLPELFSGSEKVLKVEWPRFSLRCQSVVSRGYGGSASGPLDFWLGLRVASPEKKRRLITSVSGKTI